MRLNSKGQVTIPATLREGTDCMKAPEAFVGTRPVFEEMGPELSAMVGKKPYRRLKAYLSDRDRRVAERVPLPHPVLRRR